ncbi:hypothetical protein EW146_g6473 [Bondarzewia mesenterica]|uniref:Carboxylic ester hydrolase n=1 Tax=Bondarzewia mesenterica TaxID=1095465 RepID=A0A4V3XEI4_9AGAM|nr:hypothetical protein EW146_g6473 [Bondarzewia mesenterica]
MPFNLPGTLAPLLAIINPRIILPSIAIADIRQLDFAALKRAGYRGAVFDKDNCLTIPHHDTLVPELKEAWHECQQTFGPGNVLIVSNTAGTAEDPGRLQAESATHYLRAPILFHKSFKPSYSCAHAIRSYFSSLPAPVRPHNLVVVGDRIFTDVVLAKRLVPYSWPWSRVEDEPEMSVGERSELTLRRKPLAIWTTGLWKREAMTLRWTEKKLVGMVESWVQGAEAERKELESIFVKPTVEMKKLEQESVGGRFSGLPLKGTLPRNMEDHEARKPSHEIEPPECPIMVPQLMASSTFRTFLLRFPRLAREDSTVAAIVPPLNASINATAPGGFTIGQIYDQAYDPTGIVQQAVVNQVPVIYVAMNYRLTGILYIIPPSTTINIFYSVRICELRCPTRRKLPHSGLKDQRLGIQWVKDNIAVFGGDPDNITIFGESSGAEAVGLQMLAYGGQKGAPFNRAIMQSGAAPILGNSTALGFAAVAASTNCTHGGPGSKKTLACLRNVPMETLLEAALSVFILRPLLWDWGELTQPSSKPLSRTQRLKYSTIADILVLYPTSDFDFHVMPNDKVNSQFYRASRIVRDITFTCPSIYTSFNVMKFSRADAWIYELNQTSFAVPLAEAGFSFYGVVHFSDIPYVFNDVVNASSSDSLVAAQMSGN